MDGISRARAKRLAKEFFWVGAGQVAAIIGGLAGIRLLTQALSPASYGELALGMTAAALTQQVVLGPAAGAILRFFAPASETKQLGDYLKASRRLLAEGTLLLVAIATVSGLALVVFGQIKWLVLLLGAFLFSLLSGYCSAVDGMQNAARQRAVVAWHQGTGQWLRFSLALVLIAAFGASSSAAMLGYAIASALVLGSQIVLFRRKILAMLPAQSFPAQDGPGAWTGPMRDYAWPFALSGSFAPPADDGSVGRPLRRRADSRFVIVERREQSTVDHAKNRHGLTRCVAEFWRGILAGIERRGLRRRRRFLNLFGLDRDAGEARKNWRYESWRWSCVHLSAGSKSRRLLWVYRWTAQFFDPLQAVFAVRGLPRYFRDWRRYSRMPSAEAVRFLDSYPQLHDRSRATPFDPHYFYVSGWAMRRIVANRPAKHVDVGSHNLFANLLSAVVPVTFLDYRPLNAKLAGLECIGGNLLELPFADNSVESLSCLHVAEHIGLGRYGDPLDPGGTRKAARELARVLAKGGNLYFALPVGRPRVCFNAHRVHTPGQIRDFFTGLEHAEFSGVDDSGRF